tara:strand:- start:502 stop:951 length:450 start_codon:yes stop_codon:yes gene_type:complete
MKTAKINNIDQKPNFRTNDGKTLYVFELTLDNGDVGAIFKQKENAYVQVGDSITYELTERGSIKIQREGGFTSTNKDNQFYTKEEKTQIFDAKDRRISKLAILKCSCELVSAGKIELSDVQTFSENMLNWVYDKQSTKNLEFTDDKIPF